MNISNKGAGGSAGIRKAGETVGEKGGRPLKFKSRQQLEDKINEYFEGCFEPMLNKQGEIVKHPDTGEALLRQARPFTMAGLAAYLEIDRKTLLNYSKRDKFFPTIKKARERVEAYVEEQLFRPQIAAGVIFNLKNNFKWRDAPEEETDKGEQALIEKLDEVFGNAKPKTD